MPVMASPNGHYVYQPVHERITAHPSDFFFDDLDEYGHRIEHARRKVLDAIRFAERPLSGVGTCHVFNADTSVVGDAIEQLAHFADHYDDRRASRLRSQRSREAEYGLAPHEHRLRSPQNIFRRRSVLFSGADIPGEYFDVKPHKVELEAFVQTMRYQLIRDAVEYLYGCGSLELVENTWLVRVSVMDAHRLGSEQNGKARIKRDDRSWHGRPNRDRLREAATP